MLRYCMSFGWLYRMRHRSFTIDVVIYDVTGHATSFTWTYDVIYITRMWYCSIVIDIVNLCRDVVSFRNSSSSTSLPMYTILITIFVHFFWIWSTNLGWFQWIKPSTWSTQCYFLARTHGMQTLHAHMTLCSFPKKWWSVLHSAHITLMSLPFLEILSLISPRWRLWFVMHESSCK